ncbi:hypothetical protein J2Y38_000831 [Flavobacterium sp. 2755]|uniref:hypothetical protein n=1 Tax=Flavobacterium sp. 2755 TaxID=2817765 RepID=UPI0028611DF9|nr:hypothetical protein [Flavobacterium sp. 2755]MDR6760633.1 hypothetical protein [Flavobacterium sp. 2755]
MKKLYLLLSLFIMGSSFAQIYTPYASTNATTNSSTTSNVGIGVINPIEKLTVDGNINVINGTGVYPKIGFATNDTFLNTQTNNIAIANYGITKSKFDNSSSTPTISLSGFNGINFYTNTTERMKISSSGKIGIDVTSFPTNALYANYKLFVRGGILTDEVRVSLSANGTWADYVFFDNYKLMPLSELEIFISNNKHLPNVPSAKEIKEDGINIADMIRIQQEKIEELTLYIIEQNRKIEALQAKVYKDLK